MAYIVTEQCVRCRYTDCVEVCPVDCFHAGANMLVIDPDVCIDCSLCEPECPVEAIKSDSGDDQAMLNEWLEINRKYAQVWPVIADKEDAPQDAKAWEGVPAKFASHFDPAPATSRS